MAPQASKEALSIFVEVPSNLISLKKVCTIILKDGVAFEHLPV